MTPSLRPEVTIEERHRYAADLAAAKTSREIIEVHRRHAHLREHQGLRDEIRALIHAPKGSETAKARTTLGWSLILFGLFGVPLLVWLVFLLLATVVAVFNG